MKPPSIEARIEILEQKVENFAGLPGQVASLELQTVLFREEVRSEFSAVRAEMRALNRAMSESLTARMTDLNDETRNYMRVLHEEVLSRIALLGEQLSGRSGMA